MIDHALLPLQRKRQAQCTVAFFSQSKKHLAFDGRSIQAYSLQTATYIIHSTGKNKK
jgi:hypothetical protein